MSFALDPFSTLVQLALLSFKDNGVKIGIVNNSIVFFENNWFDWSFRTARNFLYSGYSRECFFNFEEPIERAVEYYDLPLLFELAYRGLDKLKGNYRDFKSGNARKAIEATMKCLLRRTRGGSPVHHTAPPQHSASHSAPHSAQSTTPQGRFPAVSSLSSLSSLSSPPLPPLPPPLFVTGGDQPAALHNPNITQGMIDRDSTNTAASPLRTFWRSAEIDVIMLLFRLLVEHPEETYYTQLITNCLKGRQAELLPLLQQ